MRFLLKTPTLFIPAQAEIQKPLHLPLTLKTHRSRDVRACLGHPRRGAQSRYQSIAPTVADKRVVVVKPTSLVAAWMAGTGPARAKARIKTNQSNAWSADFQHPNRHTRAAP